MTAFLHDDLLLFGIKRLKKNIKLMGTYGVLRLGTSEFLFDAEDLPLIENRDWYRDKDGYLVNCYYYNGRRRFTRFHRIVMHAKPKQFVDHIIAIEQTTESKICDAVNTQRTTGTVEYIHPTNPALPACITISSVASGWPTFPITESVYFLAGSSQKKTLLLRVLPKRKSCQRIFPTNTGRGGVKWII